MMDVIEEDSSEGDQENSFFSDFEFTDPTLTKGHDTNQKHDDELCSDNVSVIELPTCDFIANEPRDTESCILDYNSGESSDLDYNSDDFEFEDSDFDTDLEFDEDKWLRPEKFEVDFTGRTKYLRACEEQGVQPTAYFLRHMDDPELSLRYHGLGPKGMKALAVPLETNTVIETLNLDGNFIEGDGAIHLAKVLRDNVYITELYLAENKIGNEGATAICTMLQENRTLAKLDLTANEIGDIAAGPLYVALKRNTALKHLILRHNCFEEEGAEYFHRLLSENESLEKLDISWNKFKTKGCILIAEGIEENFGMKLINISMNGFGLEGALALGNALRSNRTLLELDASYCRLPAEGASNISSGIENNDILRILKMGSNPLGPEGALVILKGVERNDSCSLVCVDLSNIVVRREFRELQERLEGDRSVTVMHGGVVQDSKKFLYEDPLEEFRKDPMTKLRAHLERAGFGLVDLIKSFDKDNSLSLSREEFEIGIRRANIDLSGEQIAIIMDRLDKDNDGQIDLDELIESEKENRNAKKEAMQKAADIRNEEKTAEF